MKIKFAIITSIFASVLFAALFSCASADEFCGKVTADSLNIRSSPSTQSSVIGSLSNGFVVDIYGKTENWYIINFNSMAAYINSDYVDTDIPYEKKVSERLPDYLIATNTLATEEPHSSSLTFSKDTLIPQITKNTKKIYKISGDVPSYKGSTVPGEQLIEFAKTFIGTPYVYGGNDPTGFDCSGFVKYCYSHFGKEINRVACDQALNGTEVEYKDALPGDILCFTSSEAGGYITHTGMYVGNGYFIHSPHTGSFVEITSLDISAYGDNLMNIRRIFN